MRTFNRHFVDLYPNWRDNRPQSYRLHVFDSASPLVVTYACGQNQAVAHFDDALREEAAGIWASERDYSLMSRVSFAIASHLSCLVVEKWDIFDPEDIMAEYDDIYDSPSPDTRQAIPDISSVPLYDELGNIVWFYDDAGNRIPRRSAVPAYPRTWCPVLLDLEKVNTLFSGTPIDNDEVDVGNDRPFLAAPTPYEAYPLFFSKNIGNVQAKGAVSQFRPLLNDLNNRLRDPSDTLLANIDSDGINLTCVEDANSQIYSNISHRIRYRPNEYLAVKGIVTGAAASADVSSAKGKTAGKKLVELCNVSLPHSRIGALLDNDNIDLSLRCENIYSVRIGALKDEFRNGASIHDEIVVKLANMWSDPSVLRPLRETLIVFRPEVCDL